MSPSLSLRVACTALPLALTALVGLGCDASSGHERARPERRVDAEARAKAEAAVDQRFAAGAEAFAKYCALCHAADATGYAADHAPSLVSATFLESATDEQIARGIREGRPGTAMAAYAKTRGGPLGDEEIGAIVAFLRDRRRDRISLPTKALLGNAARGEVIYQDTCQPCHGTRTDRGNAVHLANPNFLVAASDAFLRHAIVHGRPGTPMPAFAGILGEDEIDDVVAMLRSWGSPPAPERAAPPEPPPLGPVVINPNGKHPDFKLRDDRFLPIADMKQALEQGKRVVIIDARAASDWIAMHIPGSISVPYYAFTRLDALPTDGTWITAYCACPHHASGVVVDELRRRGFKHTAVLDEGILEWKKRGYPVEGDPDAAPQPVPNVAPMAPGEPVAPAPERPRIMGRPPHR